MIRALAEGVVLAVAGAVVFALGDLYGTHRERKRAERDSARARTYRGRPIP